MRLVKELTIYCRIYFNG